MVPFKNDILGQFNVNSRVPVTDKGHVSSCVFRRSQSTGSISVEGKGSQEMVRKMSDVGDMVS